MKANPSGLRRRCGRCISIRTLPIDLVNISSLSDGLWPGALASCERMRDRFIAGRSWGDASRLRRIKLFHEGGESILFEERSCWAEHAD